MYITIKEGNMDGYRVNLESYGKDVVSFGRSKDNDIVINSESVSRVHGCFFKENGGWKITDLDSTNGIYVEGYKVNERIVNNTTEVVITDRKNKDKNVVITFAEDKQLVDNKKVQKNGTVATFSKVNSVFVDPSEVQKATLGNDYIDSVIRGGGLSRGSGIVTDKRFYYRGRCYSKKAMKTDQEWTVDLKDITCTGFVYRSQLILLIIAIGAFIAAIVGLFDNEEEMAVIGVVIGLIMLILYWLTKETIYYVTFAGGEIGVDASKYGGTKVVKEFDKTLRREKDKYEHRKM
ncbi:MAG: FHA domain-containing protein [Lachnospiraceae bacterium]|nr:FHA domain-containing protein [Lachnospiraceae bacterium]